MENENFETLMQKILSLEKNVMETQNLLFSWKKHSVIKKKSPTARDIGDLIDRKIRGTFASENEQEVQKLLYQFDAETVSDLRPEDFCDFYALIKNLED